MNTFSSFKDQLSALMSRRHFFISGAHFQFQGLQFLDFFADDAFVGLVGLQLADLVALFLDPVLQLFHVHVEEGVGVVGAVEESVPECGATTEEEEVQGSTQTQAATWHSITISYIS